MERGDVPRCSLMPHPFTFDLQLIEERAMPNGWLAQMGSALRALGAHRAAKEPQCLFVTNPGSTGAVSRAHMPPSAAARPLCPAKENLPAGHAGTASKVIFVQKFLLLLVLLT